MAIEIERKFLVLGDAWRRHVTETIAMAQAYMGGDRCSVRVRIAGDQANLNIKSKVRGSARYEFEYAIALADAELMLRELAGAEVTKTRHRLRHAGHLWEVDEFIGANAGLIVAEIELDHADEAFERPDWLGREVTDEERFYNATLVQNPFSSWHDRADIIKELTC
jgi:adenylate cyclase